MIEVYIEKEYDKDLEDMVDDPYVYNVYTKSTLYNQPEFICECVCEEHANWLRSLIKQDYQTHNEYIKKLED